MWKRIIFAFTLGSALGLAILISKVYFKITQVLLTFAFIFCSIMVEILVIEELKNHEMLYLGIYISLLFQRLDANSFFFIHSHRTI